MSALIHHFVVHQLSVNADDKIAISPRPECLPVTAEIEHLAHLINHNFNVKPGKGVGKFIDAQDASEDGLNSDFPSDLADFLKAWKDDKTQSADAFQQFSVKAGGQLIKALVDTGTVESGFLVFSMYEFLATDYLMIALLNTKSHVEVNQALELSSREHLDLAKMQLAVRIDLTQWQIQPELQRYISFIKGRMGRKVSDFFMQFVGCEELVDNKQQNKQLVSTVDAYLASESLDPEEKNAHRDQVKSYFKEKIDSGETVSVAELSDQLPVNNETSQTFESFTATMEAPFEKEIQPDPAALKQLAKFTGQGGGVSLSFDRKLLGDRISYDPHTDTLVIRGIPPNLKDQLTRNSGMN